MREFFFLRSFEDEKLKRTQVLNVGSTRRPGEKLYF